MGGDRLRSVELGRRLRGRATDSDEVIRRRLSEARADLSHWPEFDYVVINDDREAALAALRGILAGGGSAYSTGDPALRAQAARVAPGPPPG